MLRIFLFIESTIGSLATLMVVINHRNIPSGAEMLTRVVASNYREATEVSNSRLAASVSNSRAVAEVST
jgi:hypothetical protein